VLRGAGRLVAIEDVGVSLTGFGAKQKWGPLAARPEGKIGRCWLPLMAPTDCS